MKKRGRKQLTDWNAVNWTKKNVEIERELNCSRSSVVNHRAAAGIYPPSRSKWAKKGATLRETAAALKDGSFFNRAGKSDEQIARKAADDLIDWIAGPVPWQEWERVDMTNCILAAIRESKGLP